MRSMSISMRVIALVLAAGCSRQAAPARVLPPAPRDATSAAVGVAVSLHLPGGPTLAPDVVYFVRLEDGEPAAAAFGKQEVLASNQVHGNRFILLNAAPGTYVAVAAMQERDVEGLAGHLKPTSETHRDSLSAGFSVGLGKAQTRTHRTYFSRDFIEGSRVRVASGAFVFMGDGTMALSAWNRKADEAQVNYQKVLEGDPALRVGRSADAQPWLGGLEAWSRDKAVEASFLDAASHDLSGSRWTERIAQRQHDVQ